MNKQDLIYKKIRQRVAFENPHNDELIVDYIVRVTKLDEIIEALKYVSLSRMWDTDEERMPDTANAKYWYEKCRILQDKAEDALLELYKE